MDEAGQTTQPPLIMAPPSLNADPVGEATDTIVDNGIMSSSRTRTGKSRSGTSRRADSANGDSSASEDSEDTGTPGDAAASGEASAGDGEPAASGASGATGEEGTTEAASGTKVPLPAETIGKAKARSGGSFGSAVDKSPVDNGRGSERQGSQPTMSSDDGGWLTDEKTGTAESADSATSSPSVAAAATPMSAKPTASPSTAPTGTGSPYSGSTSSYSSGSGSSYSGSSYSGSGSPYSSASYAPPSRYSGPAPAGAPEATPSANGQAPRNGFSAGATATVTGAAAGLASSVTSAWQRQRRASVGNTQPRKPTKRQAMLTLSRVEPWSVMKFSFVASLVAFVILFVAVAVLYMVLSALGVFDSLQNTVSSITSSQSNSGTDISHWFSASRILGYTALLGALNIVLITAMATVGSVIYNLIAKTIGGIEVTLRETD